MEPAEEKTLRFDAFLRLLRTATEVDPSVLAAQLDAFQFANNPADWRLFVLHMQSKMEKRSSLENERQRDRWLWLIDQFRQTQSSCLNDLDRRLLDEVEELVQTRPLRMVNHIDEVRISITSEHEENQATRTWSNSITRTMRSFMRPRDRISETRSNHGGSPRSPLSDATTSATTASTERLPRASSLDEVALRRSHSTSTTTVPRLLWSMANYLGLSMEETFLCQICFEYVGISKAFELTKCGHFFCEACIQSFLEFKISEGQVYPTCFHESSDVSDEELNKKATACGTEIVPEDIQSLVSEETWQKYLKFKFNKEHVNARQCPYCDHSQVCRGGQDQPACICESCGEDFCFVHSNAHRGRSCAEYEKKMVAIEKLNHAMINAISKPCPGCNNHVEKIGGCNQMKCVVCGTSFCWICCTIIDDGVFPEHFQWWNISGCPGNQMAEVEEQTVSERICMKLLRGLFFLVFGPPALLLAIVFSVLCCCCVPCTRIFETSYRNAFTTCFCVSGYVLLAPFALALGLVCSPCLGLAYWFDPDGFRTPEFPERPTDRMTTTDTIQEATETKDMAAMV